MITDHAVLQPDIQPAREIIVHRDGEIDHLTAVLEPLTNGYSTQGAFIYGPSGAGKTCTTRCVVDGLESQADVSSVTLDCLSCHSRRALLNRILERLGAGSALERRSVATDDLVALVRDRITEPTVLVLDEADHIAFDRYSDTQLVSILRERARVGVDPGVVDDRELEYIARCSDGDARKAIALLLHSVQRVRAEGLRRVSASIIDRSREDADRHIVRSRLSSLSRSQRVYLECIRDVGPATNGEIYACYRERVDEPERKRTGRDWLSKFRRYSLVEQRGPKNAPEYELRDVVLEQLRQSVSV